MPHCWAGAGLRAGAGLSWLEVVRSVTLSEMSRELHMVTTVTLSPQHNVPDRAANEPSTKF